MLPRTLLSFLFTLQLHLWPGSHPSKFNSGKPGGWTPHCLGAANPSPLPITRGSEKHQVSAANVKRCALRAKQEECEGRAAYQFIRTQNSELHSLDGAQRACAVPGGGATPVHRGGRRCAGANLSTKTLRRLRLSAQTPSGRPLGRTFPKLGGKGRRKERWGREGGGEIKKSERNFPPPFRRFLVSQKGKKKRRGKEKVWEGGEEKG